MKYLYWVLAVLSLALYLCAGFAVASVFSQVINMFETYKPYLPMARIAAVAGGALFGLARAFSYVSLARLHSRVERLERRLRHRRRDED